MVHVLDKVKSLLETSQRVVFMTGAGVSVPSGIPDYRSMTGVYQGIKEPEYLLSRTCLLSEPEVFYNFVQQLYHEDAKPNVIHDKMKDFEQTHDVTIVTQNIDGLHDAAGSERVIHFHGSLHDCYCMSCGKPVPASVYLESDKHKDCGGQIRPNVVLYEEGLSTAAIEGSIEAIAQADLIFIVGTTFKVYPFSGLIQYRHPDSRIVVINKEPIALYEPHVMIESDAVAVFNKL